MCGIIARIGEGDAIGELMAGLRNLEYRGYDSAGIALRNGDGISVFKRAGSVGDLAGAIELNGADGSVAMGHTRWSTHGSPTEENAHPHLDCSGRVAVVHNGIIDNHEELRARLAAAGHEFHSETDTEVIPHLMEAALADGMSPEEALERTVEHLEGSFAIVVAIAGEDALYATRRGSPLVLGVGDDRQFLASDVPAFLEYTDRVVYIEDGDFAVLRADGHELWRTDGGPVDRPVETVDWAAGDAEKGAFEHFMLKEIHEQPSALRQALSGRCDDTGTLSLDGLPAGTLSDVDSVHFVACGTSYHAALCGQHLLSTLDVPAAAHLASEFAETPVPLDDRSLVIGVTQSGETADTLSAIRRARERGAQTLALTNARGSTAVRETDHALFIRAGPEIGVAATKTFSGQMATLVLLAERIARDVTGAGHPEFPAVADALQRLPDDVQQVLDGSPAESFARRYGGGDGVFFIGRGPAYAIALEGALKFKEITYEHAEGFAAGELKHGPLALVDEHTPVFAIALRPGDDKTIGNVREVQARGAPVTAVAPTDATDILSVADESLPFPATHPVAAPVLANVQLQLVAYHFADRLSRAIDKPRNLAKSVTVE